MKNSSPPLVTLSIPTADGAFTARYSANGLRELDFPGAPAPAAPKRNVGGPAAPQRSAGGTAPIENRQLEIGNVRAWHKQTVAALKKTLAGHAPGPLPPLDWAGATPFQQAVWRELLKIGCGETKSYGQLAKSIRRPAAFRAVGGACGANPIPVLVPCHRVLAANHGLGGFGGGLAWKRRLLTREGIAL